MPIIDSHTHFDIIMLNAIEGKDKLINLIRKEKIIPISWAYIREQPKDLEQFSEYLGEQKVLCEKGKEYGIKSYRTIGIHPRSIPLSIKTPDDIDHEKLNLILDMNSKETDVVGIGEIGLEKATKLEIAIFEAQVRFAIIHEKNICIHTPRTDKEKIFKKTMSILKRLKPNPEKVLIDHINSVGMLKEVLEKGHYAGISVSNSKLSLAKAMNLIEKFPKYQDRIMLNSDASCDDEKEYLMFIEAAKKYPRAKAADIFFGQF